MLLIEGYFSVIWHKAALLGGEYSHLEQIYSPDLPGKLSLETIGIAMDCHFNRIIQTEKSQF